jgi:hypothetical protein
MLIPHSLSTSPSLLQCLDICRRQCAIRDGTATYITHCTLEYCSNNGPFKGRYIFKGFKVEGLIWSLKDGKLVRHPFDQEGSRWSWF